MNYDGTNNVDQLIDDPQKENSRSSGLGELNFTYSKRKITVK